MTGYLSNIILLSCYHLTPSMIYLTCDYHNYENTKLVILYYMQWLESCTCYPVLYIQWPDSKVLMYSCTPELLILSCICYSRKFDNDIINHKMRQLALGRGKLRLSICVRVYSGTRHVVQLKLPVWPVGLQATEGSAGSLLLGTILIRAYNKTLLRPCGRFHTPAMERPGSWSRACTGPTVNIVRWYPR